MGSKPEPQKIMSLPIRPVQEWVQVDHLGAAGAGINRVAVTCATIAQRNIGNVANSASQVTITLPVSNS